MFPINSIYLDFAFFFFLQPGSLWHLIELFIPIIFHVNINIAIKNFVLFACFLFLSSSLCPLISPLFTTFGLFKYFYFIFLFY